MQFYFIILDRMSEHKAPITDEQSRKRTLNFEAWANKSAESYFKTIMKGHLIAMKLDHQKTFDDNDLF